MTITRRLLMATSAVVLAGSALISQPVAQGAEFTKGHVRVAYCIVDRVHHSFAVVICDIIDETLTLPGFSIEDLHAGGLAPVIITDRDDGKRCFEPEGNTEGRDNRVCVHP